MNSTSVNDFKMYAVSSQSLDLINLSNILSSMNNENIETTFELYKTSIMSLSEEDLTLLNNFLN